MGGKPGVNGHTAQDCRYYHEMFANPEYSVTDHEDLACTMPLTATLPQLRDAEMVTEQKTPCTVINLFAMIMRCLRLNNVRFSSRLSLFTVCDFLPSTS